jgi:signal transduction histidine kinase
MVQSEKLASMGTLLFGVAHELNNPLSNISTSCQILQEEIEEGNNKYNIELLDQIDQETDRTKSIIKSLLDYSKKRAKENINLKKVVDETIRFIKGEVPTKIELTVSIPKDIMVFADKQLIQQALLNLIKNGIDAIPKQGKVSVSAHYINHNESVVIEISDSGTGMDSEMVSNIFDPFFTTKASSKGYGLGLFIVHNIIEDHKGSIMVDSEPGFGTVFTIELPAR